MSGESLPGQFEKLKELLNDSSVDWTKLELKFNTIQYVKSFQQFIPEAMRDEVFDSLRKKLNLSAGQFAFVLGCDDPIMVERALRPVETEDALYGTIFPKTGWIGSYLEYTWNHEAPLLFHYWNAVAAIGACLCRHVKFEKGYYRVYPNHYIVLVAPTGKCKKSTSAGIAVGLLRDANVIEILNEKGTPEGILDAMNKQTSVKPSVGGGLSVNSGNPSLFIFAPELGVFLGKQEYNEGLVQMLTSIADCRDGPFDYLTKSKGKLVLQSPSVHLLGCITPDGLAHSIPKSAFLGGTISRMLFVMQMDTPRFAPLPKPPNIALQHMLIAKLVRFGSITGAATMTPAAETWYEQWYRDLKTQNYDMMRLSGYYERKPDHLIRLAIVTAIAEEGSLELDVPIFEKCAAILDYTEQFMSSAFTIVDSTDQGRQYESVLDAIQRAGGRIEHSKLLKAVYRYGVNAEVLNTRIVPTLVQAGLIQHMHDSTKKINFYLLLKR